MCVTLKYVDYYKEFTLNVIKHTEIDILKMMPGQEESGEIKTRCSDIATFQKDQVFNFKNNSTLSADGTRSLKRSLAQSCLHTKVFSMYSLNVQYVFITDFSI